MPQAKAQLRCDLPTDAPAAPVEPLDCSAVLTHHWLVRRRGGEKVLEALCELLPDSPVYTLLHDPAGFRDDRPGRSEAAQRPRNLAASRVGAGAPAFQGLGADSSRIHTSFLQRIPGAKRHYPKLLPLMPLAAGRMKLPPVDLVVCSDACLAKAMTPQPQSKLVCYCHSPMRYVYDEATSRHYRRRLPLFARPLWGPTVARARKADLRAAKRVDFFVANSRHVAERIRRCYGRDSVVVHPPVDLPPEPTTTPRESFYICVGHHVPYKRLDLAITACRKLGRELVVIGEGPDVQRFNSLNDRNIRFLGWQPDQVVRDHYRRAAGLLFPGQEDFGIVPVEAMAHGCPVIAYGVGGARETVADGQTGVLFERQNADALVAAIERCEAGRFDPVALHEHVQRFGRHRFLRGMRALLVSVLGEAGRG